MLGGTKHSHTLYVQLKLTANLADPPLLPRLLSPHHLPIQARRLHGHPWLQRVHLFQFFAHQGAVCAQAID